jgi:O-antigen ligase
LTSPVLVQPQPAIASSHNVSLRRRWKAAILFGSAGLLLFEPLAFGGVEAWAIFILQAGAATLFLGWLTKRSSLGESEIVSNPLFSPMLAFAALVMAQWTFRLSAYQHATLSLALRYCAYAMIVFVMTQCLRRGSQARILATVATIFGSAVALFAMVQGAASNGRIYWFKAGDSGGWLYGPYMNHNHYAALMEILFPIAAVSFLSGLPSPNRRLFAGLAAILMASTIFLSGSRAGMLSFIVELGFLVVATRAKDKRKRTAWIAALALFACLLVVWAIQGIGFVQRLASIHAEAQTELSGGTRLTIVRDSLRMLEQRPVAGWGFGTFPTVYPKFRSFYSAQVVNQGHNDYLQFAVETGALGLFLVAWFLFRLFRSAGAQLTDWTSNVSSATALAALTGCTGFLVHSFFDFNLQIPANAALFFVTAAIAAAPPFQEPSHHRRHRSRITRDSWEPLEPSPAASPSAPAR